MSPVSVVVRSPSAHANKIDPCLCLGPLVASSESLIVAVPSCFLKHSVFGSNVVKYSSFVASSFFFVFLNVV